jgi:pyruvate/2-oxoglutarate dehydrogenase complex dihydrolipoamide dehydrogenase (E3) component
MERQGPGLVKLVLGRGGRLLGAGIVGAGAAEMISLFSLAIANGLPLGALARFAAPYPTLTEVVRAVADEALAEEPASPLRHRLLAHRRVLP